MDSNALKANSREKLLFCFGMPKSGTTYLQMILDSHPEVSCPPEHQFDFIIKGLFDLFERYNQILQVVDSRTGKQGACGFQGEDVDYIFKVIVERAALRGARGKRVKWYGINDNAIIDKLGAYSSLFPDALFIHIVRDPRAVTISSWHHNLRVEEDFLKRARDMDNWARFIATRWVECMEKCTTFKKANPNRVLFIRYEDLVDCTTDTLKIIFQFLDVDTSKETLREIEEATSIDRFKGNPFFRKGKSGAWKEELSPKTCSLIEGIAGDAMKNFSYTPVGG